MDGIKYLILDFGKVLAGPTTGHWFITPKFMELIDMNCIDRNKFDLAVRKFGYLLDKKILTEEEEYEMFYQFYNGILKDLDYFNISNKIVHQLAWNFTYSDDKYIFYDNVLEEVDSLSRKYNLLLLSDNWPCVFRILKEHQLYDYFQKIYVSSVYGEKKEDGVFFDYPINEFNIKEGEALFIDDNEALLDVAIKKKLKVRLMDRKKEIGSSRYPIIHNLENL